MGAQDVYIQGPVYIGQIFSDLIIVKPSYRKNKHGARYSKCQCVCGKLVDSRNNDLKSGNKKSCGCRTKNGRRNTFKSSGHSSLWFLYNRYQNNANTRKGKKAIFKLNFDEFTMLISQNCFYCGESPKSYNRYRNNSGKIYKNSNGKPYLKNTVDRATVYVNGIDRINSSLGYFISNTVPCCSDCNAMKSNWKQQYFINHSIKIANFQKDKK